MTNKICHITTVHSRYDVRIFHKECKSLSKYYEVYLIVADGKGDEEKDNVHIIDIGLRQRSRLKRAKIDSKKALKKAIELNCELYHFHDPELISIGLKLKKENKKVIFDIHENTDLQILEKEWIPFFLRKIVSKTFNLYEKYTCKKFDSLIVPQYAMYKKFSKINKVTVIGNFPARNLRNKLSIEKKHNKYKLLYSGAINKARGLWNMVDLIKELKKINSAYSLTIAGNISSNLLSELKEHSAWSNIEYLGFLSKDDIQKVYEEHSLGLIMFNNVGQYFMAYSLKLFEYMQNGLTVIMPNFGDWINFNNTYKTGYNIDVKDNEKTAQLINSLSDDVFHSFSEHNINSVNENFTWESQEFKIVNLYNEIFK
ncbi:MAG: glycosyltransferase family 4 protein [Chlorobi bacterium]|nr:glycosyltransferase family 4 protein [Chlorobiota bacterium]